ncbi:hypothetical protein ACFLW6_04710 [Chloroflexota bacterium]
MLKTYGINALMQVGNVKKAVNEITESDHAWVLAEVAPGQYLALETTSGQVKRKSDNELYYGGWSFSTPGEFKDYQQLRREWNLRVNMINQWQSEAKQTYAEYEIEYNYYLNLTSTTAKQAQLAVVKEKEGRYNQLSDLIKEQGRVMESLAAEMNRLTAK